MNQDRESALRALETAKAKCAQVALDGGMTVAEYTEATGQPGEKLMEQIVQRSRMEFILASAALVRQAAEAAQRVRDALAAAGAPEETVREIIGSPELRDGAVTAPDWGKVAELGKEGRS